jgi:DNA repair protein RecO (recombination protein O)
MHHIYHTHGFILSSRNVGEANKVFTIYTRELGLVRAVCQGIRLSKSKNRFALQDFYYSNIDLVRGKDVWRVTTAKPINSFAFARANRDSILLVARVSSLLDRLCKGEESNTEIFDDFIQALYILDSEIEKEKREALELHLVLRIMNSLGYIGDNKILSKYLISSFDDSKIEDLLKERQSIISNINKAISESHL